MKTLKVLIGSKMNFECEKVFHLFTRSNTNNELLFREEENYLFFLRKYIEFLSPIFHTLCYCLIPNHYHFLIKVKEINQIFEYQNSKNFKYTNNDLKINAFIQQQISNFHNSYAKSFNKKYQRRGSLFQKEPKSKEIVDLNSLLRSSRYIHRNPLKHGIVRNLENWNFSSYPDYTGLRIGTLPEKEFISSHFSSVQDFINFTNMDIDDYEFQYEFD